MQAVKLTPKEKELFEQLKSIPGGYLRQHVKPNRLVCFRLLDKDGNPIANIRYGRVLNLVDKNILHLDGHNYVLKDD